MDNQATADLARLEGFPRMHLLGWMDRQFVPAVLEACGKALSLSSLTQGMPVNLSLPSRPIWSEFSQETHGARVGRW